MYIQALVEVAGGTDAGRNERLLSAVYDLSRAGLVVLALRGISTERVDRMLDPVVRGNGHDSAGLLYVDAGDERRVIEAACRAELVVASTDAFRDRLVAEGVAPISIDDADAVLAASVRDVRRRGS